MNSRVPQTTCRATLLALVWAVFAVHGAVAADAYLQSDGNQAINTGYCITPTTAVELDFEAVEVCPNSRFFGSRKNVWFSYYTGGLPSGSSDVTALNEGWCCKDGSGNFNSTGMRTHDYLGVRRVVTIDGYGKKVKVERKSDGANLFSTDISYVRVMNETIPFYLFGMSCDANVDTGYHTKMKLYGCRVYEAGELVRDFVPAKSGDVTGLYDRVTGCFLVSQNGKAFSFGGDIQQVPDNAPYVETTGDQAFDTGYLTSPDTRMEFDFAWVQLTQNQRAFGAVNNAGSAPYVDLSCLTNSSGVFHDAWSWGDLKGNWTQMTPPLLAGYRHTVVMDSYHSRVSILYGSATNYTAAMTTSHAVTNNVSLFIGASHEKGADTAINFGKVRIYGFRIYEKDVLVHDFRPILRSARPGLKDAITGVFHGSPFGSALHTGGGIQEDGNYLESNGSQTLTTDWCPTPNTCFVADFTSIDHVWNCREFTCRRQSDSGIGLFVDYCSNNSASGNEYWSCKDDGGNYSNVDVATPNMLGVNRRLVFDSYHGKVETLIGARPIASKTMTTTRTKTCAWQLSVFGRRLSASTGTADMGAKMRLYSLKIYESGALVRDYLPYVTDEGPGLKDKLTGVFCRGLGETNLTVGASVPYSAKACDAYVESTGVTGISTGYHITPKTRISCDFAYDLNIPNCRFFGCRGDIWFSMYMNGGDNQVVGWNLGDTAQWKQFHERNVVRGARQTAVLDRKNGYVSLTSGGKTISETSGFVSTRTATGNFPLWIFSICTADTGASAFPHPMRLYRFKIYEDDVLVHDYVPKADEGSACLFDLVGRGTLALPTNKGYSVSGLGHETVAFLETPSDTFVPHSAAPAKIRCFAPGAVSYKWYRNGEELSETGPELSVAWRKTKVGDVISVKAVGTLNGKTLESDSVDCTVSYAQLGMAIFVR